MTEQNPGKMQSILWWITSIAISVLCCSILFVVFASYFVDIKDKINDEHLRINTLEQRQNALATQLENLQKPAVSAETPAAAAPAISPAEAPIGSAVPSVTPSTAPTAPAAASPTAPAEISPPVTNVAPVGSSMPVISVPTVPTNSTPPAK